MKTNEKSILSISLNLKMAYSEVFNNPPTIDTSILPNIEKLSLDKIVDIDYNKEINSIMLSTNPLEQKVINITIGGYLRYARKYDEGFILRMMYQPLILIDFQDKIIRIKNKQMKMLYDFCNQEKNNLIKYRFGKLEGSEGLYDKLDNDVKIMFDLTEKIFDYINYFINQESMKIVINKLHNSEELKDYQINYNDEFDFLSRMKNINKLHNEAEKIIKKQSELYGSDYKRYEEE